MVLGGTVAISNPCWESLSSPDAALYPDAGLVGIYSVAALGYEKPFVSEHATELY